MDPAVAPASRLTAALVATPSVNPELEEGGTGEAEIAALAARWLEGWGFEVSLDEVAPGRPNVVARLRRGQGRRLILNGHLDTVGTAGMTVRPFEAATHGGRLYGRGACDMKAGVAALLAAARDAARGSSPDPAAPHGPTRGSNRREAAARGAAAPGPASEHAAGPGTARAPASERTASPDVAPGSVPEQTVVPGVAPGSVPDRGAARDASVPAFHGELIVALTADEEHASLGMQALVDGGLEADGAVVCEPTGLAIMPAHKGFAWIEVTFRGRAAHGSRPERGVDAIRHAARFVAALDTLDSELAARSPHPLLGTGSLHAGTIAGGAAPSVYPADCRIVLERRTLPGESSQAVQAEIDRVVERLRSQIPDLQATTSLLLARPGTEVATEARVVEALEAALAGQRHEPAITGMTAWVDAAFLNDAGIPAVCFGPGDIEHAHAADESVALAEIEVAHAALGRFIRRFLAG